MKNFWGGFEKKAFIKKRPYKDVGVDIDPHDADTVWTAKIDGAHAVVDMRKGFVPEFYSHRTSKRTNAPIKYNDKLPHIQHKSPFDAIIRTEVYATHKDGTAVHPDVVTALLNRKQDRAMSLISEMGIKTRTAIIDVDKFQGQDVSAFNFADKKKIIDLIAKKAKGFTIPDTATTPEAKAKMLSDIKAGLHPQTKEGVVVHSLSRQGHAFGKAKFSDDHDVYVRAIFDEEGVKDGRVPMAGGFTYSWEPSGQVVGKVGTGFDHALKKDMMVNPRKYIGRVAMVRALSISKNNVLMKPSFTGWHVDKNIGKSGF